MPEPRTPQLEDLERDSRGEPSVAWWRSAAITGAALALALGGLAAIWLLAGPLTLVLVAIIIAQALAPIVSWGEQWLPRSLTVVVLYLLLLVVLGGFGWWLLPQLVDQAGVLADNTPSLIQRGRSLLQDIDAVNLDRITAAAESAANRFSDVLLSLPFTLFSSLLDIILVFFMSAYWLIATPALRRFVLSLFPEEHRDRVGSVLGDMGQTMGGFVRGTIIDSIAVAILTYIGLLVIGTDYPLLLAVIQGFGELVPVVGPIFAAIPAILVAFAASPEQALIVIVFFIVLQQVESNLLVPVIMREQADVPPLLSLIAVTAGTALGGLVSGLIAIPLAGALRILVVRIVAPAERDWSGIEDEPTEVGVKPDE